MKRAQRTQCTHVNPRGTRCRSTASDGTTCARHAVGYVAKPRKTSADIAKRPPTNSLGEPWVEGQRWHCACGASGDDRDDVAYPEHCDRAPRYSPPEHDAAIQERRTARAAAQADDDLAEHIAETDRLLDEAEAAVLALPTVADAEPCPTCGAPDALMHGCTVFGCDGPGTYQPTEDSAAAAALATLDVDKGARPPATTSAPPPAPLDQAPQASHPDREDGRAAPEARSLLRARGHEVWLADWRQLAERAAEFGGVDTTMPDAPYSERTHSGHDSGTGQANRVADWGAREAAKGRTKKAGGVTLARMVEYAEEHGAPRRALNYQPWTDVDVSAFVDAWAPLTRGWFGALTDHALAPFWEAAFKRHGRYVFSPLACVDPGSRFRAVGDGPSQWSCWLVVSRPSTGAWLDEWRDRRRSFGLPRALRGAHSDPRGRGDSQSGNREAKVPGAKPLWMMLDILSDYSMPGELVADPTCGGGTLGEAADILGRRALLGDVMPEHAEQTARVMRGLAPGVVADADRDSLQLGLLGAVGT